jgi:predicted RNase H-like HicB family nuclease
VTYTVLIYKAEEGGYWATVPELPGCGTQGETIEEVEENVKDAIEEYFHALKFAGRPMPPEVERKIEVPVG